MPASQTPSTQHLVKNVNNLNNHSNWLLGLNPKSTVHQPIAEDKEVADDKNSQRSEWVMVAVVMDRLFLVCFLLTTTTITLVLMLDHP